MAGLTVARILPGPPGRPGVDGATPSNGSNAFTLTTANFVMPAVGANVTITVNDTAWISENGVPASGQILHIQNAGYMLAVTIVDATHVTVQNPTGYTPGNATAATVIPLGSKVSPAGVKGTDGANGAAGVGVTVAVKGDVQTHDAINPASLAVGTNGQALTADSTAGTGLAYKTITPNGVTDNLIARFDASGVTTPTPTQASSLAITDTGALQHTGGNAKGTDAIDLQPSRSAAVMVASGNNSVISGGIDNRATADKSSVGGGNTNQADGTASHIGGGEQNIANNSYTTVGGGTLNTASGQDATVAGGRSNTASGTTAVVAGGNTNTASGVQSAVCAGQANTASGSNSFVGAGASNTASNTHSSVPGGNHAVADKYGQLAHASGRFASSGDAQTSELLWRIQTTDATANVELFLDASLTQRATVPNNTTWAFVILIVARRSNGDSICFKVEGGIKNDAGNTVLVAATTETVIADGTGGALTTANIDVNADNANDALRIQVTGIAAQTWRWVAHGRIVECGH